MISRCKGEDCYPTKKIDQFINEGTLRLMAPQTNHEQLRILHLLDIGAILDDLVLVRLGNTGHTTEDTSKLTDSEDVMEFCGSGKEFI